MNETRKWVLLLGSAVVAALELPRGSEVLAHDLTGPYCSCASHADADDPAGPRLFAAGDEWLTADHDPDAPVDGADTEARFHAFVDGDPLAGALRSDR